MLANKKNNLTYPNKTPPKMSLPNYLRTQYNLQPTNSLNYKPTQSQPLNSQIKQNKQRDINSSIPNVSQKLYSN